MVLDNKHDYDTIAQLYYSDYRKYYAGTGILSYSGGDAHAIRCCSIIFDHKIVLTDEEYSSVQKIATSYRLGKKDWDSVYVYDTFVSFCTENGRESLVYSAKGKRPSYINTPDDDNGIIAVNKITEHWYYMSDW
ncbi:MAG: hypothetical protein NC225_07555 [Clostridium sp.]|nr:hypothetical protein [Clostridium sp.]